MNDIDVSFNLERSAFEDMCKPLLEILQEPIKQALKEANLEIKNINSMQLIGGGSYIPFVRESISKIFGMPVSTTVNATESVSRGCGIAAALLSSKFTFSKDKQFYLLDSNYYPIDLGWKTNDSQNEDENFINKTQTVFKHNDNYPASKLLRFKKTDTFNIFALYNSESTLLPKNIDKNIAKFTISGISKDKKIDEIKVKIGLSKSGIIEIDSAQQCEEVEYLEEVKEEKKTPTTTTTTTPTTTPQSPSETTTTPTTQSPSDTVHSKEEKKTILKKKNYFNRFT